MRKSSLILCVFLILPLPSWAEDAISPLGEQAQSSLDALKKANKYSFDTGGIGILIAYGKKNGVSAEAIGDACVFQTKVATYSTAKLPPIPFESCHLIQ